MIRAQLMRRIVSAGFVGLLSVTTAMAQDAGQGPRNGRGSGPLYDSAKEVTVQGIIKAVHSDVRPWGRHLTLKMDTDTLDVALGPAWFLSEQKVTLATGDSVEVTGAKVTTREGEPNFVARLVKKGNTTFTLRNEQGVPLWSRSKRR